MIRILVLVGLLVTLTAACNQRVASDKENKAQQRTDSIEIVTELITHDSTNENLYLTRARLNMEQGMIDPAFRDVNAALEINPKDPNPFLLLSDLYFILGNLDDAFAALRKASVLAPGDVRPYVKMAQAYLIIKNYSMALKSADRAISINQNNADAYFLKGVSYLEQGDTARAILNLQVSENLDTIRYVTYMQLASIYQQQGDTAAVGYYDAALRAQPNDEKALFGLARLYQDMGRFDEALEKYADVNRNYPMNKEAFFNRGYIYLVELNDYDQAVRAFQQAIHIDPSYVEAVYNLGRTYEAQGLFDEAAVQYRQALKLHTNYPLAIEGLNRMGK